jgi:YNFM family putative membrane transporter
MIVEDVEPAREFAPRPIPWRAVVLLSLAAFASAASIRVADPLLPAIGDEFGVSTGVAANVVIAFSITYGMFQLVGGLIGDRFGKFQIATAATLLSGFGALLCVYAVSIDALTVARLASGAVAAAIMPMALAWIGDAVDFDQRQNVLARFLPGQILGVVFGQAVGGVLGELLGWRWVFLIIAGLQFAVGAALLAELWTRRKTERQAMAPGLGPVALFRRMGGLLGNRWVQTVLAAVFVEGFAVFGALAFLASHLQLEFGLSVGRAELVVATFGLGGLIFSLTSRRLIEGMGQGGLARRGGLVLSITFGLLSVLPTIWLAPILCSVMGFGFYMLHNTLQVSATQMAPEARGAAVAIYASALFFGQTAGVAIAAMVFDKWGAAPIFVASSIILPLLASWFSSRLSRDRKGERLGNV